MTLLQLRSPHTVAAILLLCGLFVVGCNDKPTDVGSILVPGTDTLYASSSTTSNILSTVGSNSEREPFYNSTFVLFGKTSDSEARLFIEFINYPKLGAADSFEVLSSDFLMYPETYVFGDTLDASFSVRSYELQQVWSAQATWDSIWAADGSTTYYSETQPAIADYSTTIDPADTVIVVPYDLEATKRWLTLGADSSTVSELFGNVLIPTNTSSIRQFRNLRDLEQKMRLRVVTKHADSTEPDTNYIDAAVACFVDTPPAEPDELLVQGARIHRAAFEVRIDSIPEFAIILGSKFRVIAETNRSQIGTGGLDEVLALRYRSKSGDLLTILTRGNGQGVFEFNNIVPILQEIREDGGIGTIELVPTDKYEFWRMNRLWIYSTSTESENLGPVMTLVYTVPTVLQ